MGMFHVKHSLLLQKLAGREADRIGMAELLVPIFQGGELVYQLPALSEIQAYCAQQVDTLWDEVKRFDNPHTYYVDLSQKLWDIKDRLLHEGGKIS